MIKLHQLDGGISLVLAWVVISFVGCGSGISNSATPEEARCSLGSSWTTVDDFQLTQSGTNHGAWVNSTASAADGTLYWAGVGYSSEAPHWIIRKSADKGSSWTTIDDYEYSTPNYSIAKGVFVDSARTVWTFGSVIPIGGSERGIVRRQLAGASSWETVEDYAGLGTMNYQGMVPLASGHGLFVGYSGDGGNTHWFVRKADLNLATPVFSTVDDYMLDPSDSSIAYAATLDSQGNVYVVGHGRDALGYRHGIIRKSADGGVTWSLLLNYQMATNRSSDFYTVTVNSDDDVFVGGLGTDSTGGQHMILKRSKDHGVTWETIQDLSGLDGPTSELTAHALGFDSGGALYIATDLLLSTPSSSRWQTLKATSPGSSPAWTTVDDFVADGAVWAAAYSFAKDPIGNLYIGGTASSISATPYNNSRAIVRKLSCL